MYKELLENRRRNSVPNRCELKATCQREVKSSSPHINYTASLREDRNTKLPSLYHNKEIGVQMGSPVTSREVSVPRSEALRRPNAASKGRASSPIPNRSTPKKPMDGLKFLVSGKKILGRSERANSLPGSSHLYLASPKANSNVCRTPSVSSKSPHTSLADDITLDLSQDSDDEDTASRCSQLKNQTFTTSTPKYSPKHFSQLRRASLQNYSPREVSRRAEKFTEEDRTDFFLCSREDSVYKTISAVSDSRYNSSSDLAYSSTSPDYSGPSSAASTSGLLHGSSSCLSYQECSEVKPVDVPREPVGEWHDFWINYSSSLAAVAVDRNYDQCPTPFARETGDDHALEDVVLAGLPSGSLGEAFIQQWTSFGRNDDYDKYLYFSAASTLPVPTTNNLTEDNLSLDGLTLTNSETRDVIKCAKILGNVLTTAIERKTRRNEEKKTKNDQRDKIKTKDIEKMKTKDIEEMKTKDIEEMKTKRFEKANIIKHAEIETKSNEHIQSTKETANKEEQERKSMKNSDIEIRKKSLTLHLKELSGNKDVGKRREAVTQTDN